MTYTHCEKAAAALNVESIYQLYAFQILTEALESMLQMTGTPLRKKIHKTANASGKPIIHDSSSNSAK